MRYILCVVVLAVVLAVSMFSVSGLAQFGCGEALGLLI